MYTPSYPGTSEDTKAKFDQQLAAFARAHVGLGMACAKFARTFADMGNLDRAAAEIAKAQNEYDHASALLRDIAGGLSLKERASIDNEMAALERLIDVLNG